MIKTRHLPKMPVSAVWPDCSGLTAFFIPAERKCSPLYQALYRKWRPQIFDDVVGQSHITQTLKKQVQTNRLSHAYLFTGTRGTGKTTCAKILAKAVNCQSPIQGNPCGTCPACVGIDSGAILDVVELDAASNNGVDQIRALRDEAVYAPAAVRKRVYIVDEVHMLSTAAFNALLKILEEPPEHLMFILATTELHKVPATILSRCQRFSFKRILSADIQNRLQYIAQQEAIDLTPEGASLLARLADGALRDALSLLDQCAVSGRQVNRETVLDTLGLAGNLKTAHIMNAIAAGDTSAALTQLAQLYDDGKDVGAVLSELSALTRDLLIRKTASQGGEGLMTGGYDQETMELLARKFPSQRLLQMLELLQSTQAGLRTSANRRTDAELCLIQLCEVELDQSLTGLSARIAQLEAKLAGASPVQPVATPAPVPQTPPTPKPVAKPKPAPKPEPTPAPLEEDLPPWNVAEPTPAPSSAPVPWDESLLPTEEPPLMEEELPLPPEPSFLSWTQPAAQPEPVPAPVEPAPVPEEPAPVPEEPPVIPVQEAPVAASPAGGDRNFWLQLVPGLRAIVGPGAYPVLNNPAMCEGVLEGAVLTLYLGNSFARPVVSRENVRNAILQAASDRLGTAVQLKLVDGKAPAAPAEPTGDPFAQLLDFGRKNHFQID